MSRESDIRALERRAFRAWPALETHSTTGWVQRLSAGYTKRANSINAFEQDIEFSQSLKVALEAPYRARELPPIWRLSPLAPPEADSALARAGYRRIDESLVQRCPLDGGFSLDAEVRIDPAPPAAW